MREWKIWHLLFIWAKAWRSSKIWKFWHGVNWIRSASFYIGKHAYRQEECNIDDIAGFLQMVIKDSYSLFNSGEQRNGLLHKGRHFRKRWKVVDFKFKNLETKKDESIPLKFIDTSYYEIKNPPVQTYRPGHGSAFKTREIYSEFRINVTSCI